MIVGFDIYIVFINSTQFNCINFIFTTTFKSLDVRAIFYHVLLWCGVPSLKLGEVVGVVGVGQEGPSRLPNRSENDYDT